MFSGARIFMEIIREAEGWFSGAAAFRPDVEKTVADKTVLGSEKIVCPDLQNILLKRGFHPSGGYIHFQRTKGSGIVRSMGSAGLKNHMGAALPPSGELQGGSG